MLFKRGAGLDLATLPHPARLDPYRYLSLQSSTVEHLHRTNMLVSNVSNRMATTRF